MPDILPGYTFNPSTNQYRSNATGQFVSRRNIVALLDANVTAGEGRLAALTIAAHDGRLSPSAFAEQFRTEIRRLHLQNASLGSGGWANMTQADYGRVGGKLTADYRRAEAFAQAIASGEITLPQALNRARLYAGNARTQYWESWRVRQDPQIGRVIIEKRNLGAAEHCFPAGTMIATPSGEKRIEDISVGDMVKTMIGSKRVTKLYRRFYSGNIHLIGNSGNDVLCTPNHPFLTDRGWTEAKDLLVSDNLVRQEDIANYVKFHVGFPNANDGVATSGEVSVLRYVSGFLFNLPFLERLKPGVTMPPVAVCLNNKIAYLDINDKFGLDQIVRFVSNTEFIKDTKQFLFKLSRLVFLDAPLAFKKLLDNIGAFFPQSLRLRSQSFSRTGFLGRVIFSHVLGSFIVNNAPSRLLCENKIEPVRFIPNSDIWDCELIPAPLSTAGRIVIEQKGNLIVCPNMHTTVLDVALKAIPGCKVFWPSTLADISAVARQRFANTLSTEIPLALPDFPALLTFTFFGTGGLLGTAFETDFRVPIPLVPAIGADMQVNEIGILKVHSFSPESALYLGNVTHNQILPYSGMVYNLEVEDVHHYIANGFVVHNCNDCTELHARGWQMQGVLPSPGDGSTECLSGCMCTIEAKQVDILVVGEWLGTRR